MLLAIAVFSQALRTALFAGGVLVLALATADWAVRTRRVNPFSGLARFMRGRVDPRLVGVERLVLRAGGHQSATPWWGAFAYVVLALLLLALVDVVLGAVTELTIALSGGVRGLLGLAVHWTFGILILALLVRVAASWVPGLARSHWAAWSVGATEWMLRPLRRVLPPFGPVDISPLAAYFAVRVVQYLVEGVLFGIR